MSLSIRFLFVRLRFRYCFFSPIPHDMNLASRFRVRRKLRPLWTFTTDERHARHTTKRHGLPQTIPILSFSVYDATQDCLHNMIFVHVVLSSGFPATRRPAVVHVFHRPFSLRFPVAGSAARAEFPYRIENYFSVFFSLRQENLTLSYIFIHFLNSRLCDF